MTKWINTPKRHYIITTDQGRAEVDAEYLDYKATKEKFRKAGYTNVNIVCIGRRYNFTV